MRASTVFALALSLLIALAAAAGAKYAGVFEKRATPTQVLEKPAPTKVLVSLINLYEDVTVTYDQVAVRELNPGEEEQLRQRLGSNWKDRLMAPLVTAAHQRVLRQTMPADSVLLKEYFTEPGLPHALGDRLEPNTRAVNVSVSKEKAAGGAIRVGEYVDLLLTSKVTDGVREETRTACIARTCKVIMKRNNPWTMMANDPDDKPVHFTLQANAYRAALIEYAQSRGQLSLMPVTPPTRISNSFSDSSSKEYASEDQRIEEVIRGERIIGDTDLMRIFRVNPRSPARPVVIQHLSGVNEAGRTVFPAPGTPAPGENSPSSDAPIVSAPLQPASGLGSVSTTTGDDGSNYTFRLPSATGDSGSGCKNCDEKKKAAEDAKNGVIRP
jgi:Flp pilus assembly protein CpaB